MYHAQHCLSVYVFYTYKYMYIFERSLEPPQIGIVISTWEMEKLKLRRVK